MKTKVIHITDKNINQVSYDFFSKFSSLGNSYTKDNMKKILHKAIQSELTDRQRMCLIMYYYQGVKMKDIATELGLSNSTVSRHITSAKRKLKHIAQYYL